MDQDFAIVFACEPFCQDRTQVPTGYAERPDHIGMNVLIGQEGEIKRLHA
jgi:hypothetical protein